jgi:hypothetical protein
MSKIQDNTNGKNTIEDESAKAIVGLLNQQASRPTMRVAKRLENARVKAVTAHEAKLSGVKVNADGTLSGWFTWTHQPRMVFAGLLCAILVASVVYMQNVRSFHDNTDALLLGSELPPEAFVDRGFEPWLNAKAEI